MTGQFRERERERANSREREREREQIQETKNDGSLQNGGYVRNVGR